MKTVLDRGKNSKTMNEVKPVKNTYKNLLSFLMVSYVEKEFPQYKLQDHVY